jgi:CID domain
MAKPDPLKSKMSEHHFSEAHFEKSLTNLKNTQESIAGLSSWCLQHKQHHKKIVNCWFRVMKKGLFLFVVQNDEHYELFFVNSKNGKQAYIVLPCQ